jgi:hypothetical protein
LATLVGVRVRDALLARFLAVFANNRAGGWRRLQA